MRIGWFIGLAIAAVVLDSAVAPEIEFLLRDRYDRALPTILTSNMGTSSIKARFGDSMASFIWEAFPPVVLDGADRRRS